MAIPGSPAALLPADESTMAREIADLKRQVREQAAARSLAASQIGAGGLLINDGGSLTIEGTGSLNVGSGALNSAGTINAVGAITAGGVLTGSSLAIGGTGQGFDSAGNAFAGGVTASGAIAAAGQVSGNTGVFHGGLHSTNARNFVVVTNYAASWIDINGHFGISPSTMRFKKNAEEWAETDIVAFFSIAPLKYHLSIPDRLLLDFDEAGEPILDPETGEQTSTFYEGFEEDDTAPKRAGFSAEALIDAGFEEAVVFDEDGLPVSINYAEWVMPQQMALRFLYRRHIADRKRIVTLESDVSALKSEVAELKRRMAAAGI